MRAVQLFHLVPEALAVVFYTQALGLSDQPHLEKPILLLEEDGLVGGRLALGQQSSLSTNGEEGERWAVSG